MIWFKRLSLFSTFLTLCVVVFGAYVRLTDAGLGCPDWPGCFGTLSVPESVEAIAQANNMYPDSIVEVGKAWREMIHRYLAGVLGLLIVALSFLAIKNRNQINVPLYLPLFLVGLVIFQAALGMWTVTELLKPVIVSVHLIGGMTILGLLTYITHRHFGTPVKIVDKNLVLMARFAILLLFIQIFLGGWTSTNYAALACTDFPTCHGSLVPDMDFRNGFSIFRDLGLTTSGDNLSIQALHAIQWVHRVGAVILVTYFLFFTYFLSRYSGIRFYRNLLILVLISQFIIGVANLLLYLPIALATMHNLGAALLVIIIVIINSRLRCT
jgi:cytochrome c oxidase assembly protein subunit 15|tara:strand:+ start:278 stop:1252 length:975 start_codon:yes stop_codon:yes gene_type:complete